MLGVSVRSPASSMRWWRLALPALFAAVVIAVLLVQLMMAPPSRELRDLAIYFVLAGITTLAGGWLGLLALERVSSLSIRAKAFLAVTVAMAVALLNVLIMAQLMFVSTSHDLQLLVALLAFSGMVTTVFTLWVATTVSDRVTHIGVAIRELASGRLDTRLRLEGGDEVAALADDVDRLALRLEESDRQRAALDRERRDLTAAISHDLRTPLASLRAMVEALSDGVVNDAEEVDRYHATMRREIERLSRMIDDLFELAQIDAGALRLERRPLTLQEVAAEVVDGMQAAAKRVGVELTLEVRGEPPPLALDGARLERAVANLVRNAIEHTPPGGRVRVSVSAEGDAARLGVVDGGPGVDAEDLPHVWERFYRGEKSRRRGDGNGDGAGLGLAIVRGIVEAHGGAVGVDSEPGAGAEFSMELPLHDRSAPAAMLVSR